MVPGLGSLDKHDTLTLAGKKVHHKVRIAMISPYVCCTDQSEIQLDDRDIEQNFPDKFHTHSRGLDIIKAAWLTVPVLTDVVVAKMKRNDTIKRNK